MQKSGKVGGRGGQFDGRTLQHQHLVMVASAVFFFCFVLFCFILPPACQLNKYCVDLSCTSKCKLLYHINN